MPDYDQTCDMTSILTCCGFTLSSKLQSLWRLKNCCGLPGKTAAIYQAVEQWLQHPASRSPTGHASPAVGPHAQHFSLDMPGVRNPILLNIGSGKLELLYMRITDLNLSLFIRAGINVRSILTFSQGQNNPLFQPGGPCGPCSSFQT